MKYFIQFIFITWSLSLTIKCKAQDQLSSTFVNCDTLSKERFNSAVEEYLCFMEKDKVFFVDELKILVRIYNTLHLAAQYQGTKVQKDFGTVFDTKYRHVVMNKFECVPAKGLIPYSEKYDMYVGGGVKFRCNDIYIIN